MERRHWHPIGPLGVAFAFFTSLLTLKLIWFESWYDDNWEKATAASWLASVTIPHIGLISMARLRTQWTIVQTATIVVTAILAGIVLYCIYGNPKEDLWARILGIAAIATACGTIAVPILHRVSAISLRESISTTALMLELTCPRCAKKQELGVGRSKCGQCGLKFVIEIEEDNCRKCGYPLYKLTSPTCPECGTSIVQ